MEGQWKTAATAKMEKENKGKGVRKCHLIFL